MLLFRWQHNSFIIYDFYTYDASDGDICLVYESVSAD